MAGTFTVNGIVAQEAKLVSGDRLLSFSMSFAGAFGTGPAPQAIYTSPNIPVPMGATALATHLKVTSITGSKLATDAINIGLTAMISGVEFNRFQGLEVNLLGDSTTPRVLSGWVEMVSGSYIQDLDSAGVFAANIQRRVPFWASSQGVRIKLYDMGTTHASAFDGTIEVWAGSFA